jgi:hypothetical protein
MNQSFKSYNDRRYIMLKISYALISLSCFAFVMAVICTINNIAILGAGGEAFSRACNGLALIGIALAIYSRNKH